MSQLPEQLRSLGRFPVPVAVSITLTLFLNFQIAGLLADFDRFEGEIIFASAGAFLGGLMVALWSISRPHNAIASVLASIVAAAAAALLQLSHGHVFSQDVVALGGLALATMAAAHLRRGATIESFWQFSLQLGLAVTMGTVALIIVCAGLSLLLQSCRYLFDVRIAGSIHEHIWVTGATLIAPLFALAMIPAEVDEPFVVGAKPDLLEKAVFYVLNFALAPLVLVYALMLHIYAAKAAIAANMPKGEVGRLVLAFGIIGTAAYMVAYPWREVGFRPVRWFMRSWFWLMVVPTFLLILAIWQRITEYGVTPERYCLCLFAIWLAAMVVYLGVRRGRIDLRVIPASLALGLVLSSFGPWGATAVSVRSQLGHFHRLLRKQNLLVNGRLKLDPPRLETFARIIAFNDRLGSILTTLASLDALDRIAPIFTGMEDNPFRQHISDERLRSVLGMHGFKELSREQAIHSQPPKGVASENSIALNVDVGRYDRLIGPIWVRRDGQINAGDPGSPATSEAEVGGVPVSFSDPVLCAGRGPTAVSFNLAAVISPGKPSAVSPILVPAREGRQRAMLILVRPSEITDRNRIDKFEVWLLLNVQASGQRFHSVKSP